MLKIESNLTSCITVDQYPSSELICISIKNYLEWKYILLTPEQFKIIQTMNIKYTPWYKKLFKF